MKEIKDDNNKYFSIEEKSSHNNSKISTNNNDDSLNTKNTELINSLKSDSFKIYLEDPYSHVHGDMKQSENINETSIINKSKDSPECENNIDELNEKSEYDYESEEYKNMIFTLKLLNFLSGFTGASWGRLSAIFYTYKGLTPTEIGVLDGFIMLLRFITIPAWGYISDKTRNKKNVFLFCSAVSTVTLCFFAFDSITSKGTWMIYLIAIVTSMFTNRDILDPYALEILGKNSTKWGDLRVWKAISWGLGSFIFTGIYNIFENFQINFLLFFICNCINSLLVYIKLPSKTKNEKIVTSDKIKYSDVLKALFKVEIIFFIFELMIIYMLFSLIGKLLFIFVIKELEGPVWITGTIVFLTVTFEIPIFLKADYLLKKYSYFTRISFSMIAYIIRMIGYVMVTHDTVEWILPFEFTHGITFGFVAISSTQYIKEVSPKHIISSCSSLINLLTNFLGNCIGFIVGGRVMEVYSGKTLYTYAGIIMAGLFILHNIVYIFFKICKKKEIRSLDVSLSYNNDSELIKNIKDKEVGGDIEMKESKYQ